MRDLLLHIFVETFDNLVLASLEKQAYFDLANLQTISDRV